MDTAETVVLLDIESLIPYINHPFKPYSGQRLDDLTESVRERGIMLPIIVRHISDGKYEILSGHNRVAAVRNAELETVPAVIRENISDEDALLIVTESNLLQRSFADLLPSERALALSLHYDAIKQKGYKQKVIKDIEKLTARYSPLANNLSLTAMSKTGAQYGLSKDSVARYLRVNKLIPELKQRLDAEFEDSSNIGGSISIRTAVALSYLNENEQRMVDGLLSRATWRIDMRKAEALRKESEQKAAGDNELSQTDIERLMSDDVPTKTRIVRVKDTVYSQYFTPEQKPDEVQTVVAEALRLYFANKQNDSANPQANV